MVPLIALSDEDPHQYLLALDPPHGLPPYRKNDLSHHDTQKAETQADSCREDHIEPGLLIAIGTLLIGEAGVAWEPAGLPLGDGGRAVVGLGAGRAIGTLSLLISLPTMLVGLGHHRARGAFAHRDDLRRLVTPMSVGAIAGGTPAGCSSPTFRRRWSRCCWARC
jgi:hypothetical protein